MNYIGTMGGGGGSGDSLPTTGGTLTGPLTGTNEYLSGFIQIGPAPSNIPVTGAIRLANNAAIIWANNGVQTSGPSITALSTNNTMQIAAPAGITLANAVTFGSSVSGATSFQSTGAISSLTGGHSTSVNSGSVLFSATALNKDVTVLKSTTAGASGRPIEIRGQFTVGTGVTKGGDVIINAGTGSQSGGISLRLGATNIAGAGSSGMTLHPSGTGETMIIGLVRHFSGTSATAGGSGSLPASIEGYLNLTLNGNAIRVPFYRP